MCVFPKNEEDEKEEEGQSRTDKTNVEKGAVYESGGEEFDSTMTQHEAEQR